MAPRPQTINKKEIGQPIKGIVDNKTKSNNPIISTKKALSDFLNIFFNKNSPTKNDEAIIAKNKAIK